LAYLDAAVVIHEHYIERRLDNGDWITLQKMLGQNYRISLGDGWMNIHSNYCYHSAGPAHECFLSWDGEDDPPEGWYKHIETGRRRPDYTKGSEIVAW
jgi:hypothetical protein